MRPPSARADRGGQDKTASMGKRLADHQPFSKLHCFLSVPQKTKAKAKAAQRLLQDLHRLALPADG